jgi:hypothetical protein
MPVELGQIPLVVVAAGLALLVAMGLAQEPQMEVLAFHLPLQALLLFMLGVAGVGYGQAGGLLVQVD